MCTCTGNRNKFGVWWALQYSRIRKKDENSRIFCLFVRVAQVLLLDAHTLFSFLVYWQYKVGFLLLISSTIYCATKSVKKLVSYKISGDKNISGQ